MSQNCQEINQFLVRVFNKILKTEEEMLVNKGFNDLSMSEIHVIDAVCRVGLEHGDTRMSAIAKNQRITAGSLSVSVALLEKKGYLQKIQDSADKRVYRLMPTSNGQDVFQQHDQFHQKMVDEVLDSLSSREVESLVTCLQALDRFFSN